MTLRTEEDTVIWRRKLWIAICGGIVVEEALNLSSHWLLDDDIYPTFTNASLKMATRMVVETWRRSKIFIYICKCSYRQHIKGCLKFRVSFRPLRKECSQINQSQYHKIRGHCVTSPCGYFKTHLGYLFRASWEETTWKRGRESRKGIPCEMIR